MTLVLCWQPAYSEKNTAAKRLIEQGYYWFDQGHYDLAESSWRKVLMMEPDNKEAHAGLDELAAIKETGIDRDKLKQARQLIQEKQYDAALQAYRQSFRNRKPTGLLALEYYQTLGGTESGWPEAIEKLQELMQKHPSNPRYVLALGQVKTYREKTRREGIKLLSSIIEKPSVRKQAMSAQKQALLWLDAHKEDKALYRDYLKLSEKQDKEVTKKLATLGKATQGIGLAYQLLNEKKIAQAEAEFKQVLQKEPNNADAWAGMGLLKLRQQNFSRADTLLTKAIKLAPDQQEKWQKARSTARYWSMIKQGDRARRKGRLRQARQFVIRARKIRPNHKEGLLLLAQIEADSGQESRAIQYYRKILDQYPKDTRAKRGLMMVLNKSRDHQKVTQLIKRYNLPEIEINELKMSKEAESLLKEAQQLKRSNTTLAVAKLRAARSLDPDHVWLNYELAKLYAQNGQTGKAYRVFDELLYRHPHNREALYAKALLTQESKDWLYGIETLEKIPKNRRTPTHQSLLEKLYGQYQREQIIHYQAEGNWNKAQQLVNDLSQRSDKKPELLMILAQSQIALEQPEEALSTAQLALVQSGQTPSVGLQLSYANILFETGQYQEFDHLVQSLQRKSGNKLTDQQRYTIHQMALGKALREVDHLRQNGHLVQAYKALLPWLESDPENQNVLGLMAELYRDTGDHRRALGIFQKTAELHPEKIHNHINVATEALNLNDFETAEFHLNESFNLDPEEPSLYALQANLARARGDKNAAVQNLQQALSLYYSSRKENSLSHPFHENPYSPVEQRFPFEPYQKYKGGNGYKASAHLMKFQ